MDKMTHTRDRVYQESLKYFNGDELAASVFVDKYALQNDGTFYELTPDDMHRRLAKEFARIEKKYDNPLTENEIYESLKNFNYIIPGGSALAGVGNNFNISSISNCYYLGSPVDSYGGILKMDQELVQVGKRRGGTGISISSLRPANTPVTNSAKSSSGAVSFCNRFSNTIREVAQSGRRGALLIDMECRHPDIVEFIKVKSNDKSKVTGANISIKFFDDFLKAVEKNSNYILRFPTNVPVKDATFKKEVNAKEIWDLFIDSVWKSGEPGCFFWDTVIENSIADCYKDDGFETKGSNPCISGGCKVLTVNGTKTINEINVGDSIYSSEGYTKVIGKHNRGIKKVYKYKTDIGNDIYLTTNHNIISNGQKIPVIDANSIDVFKYNTEINTWELNESSSKIISCDYIGEEEVYDITVDNKTHTFWCNQFNIANCGELVLSERASCLLLSLNLKSFVIDGKFNFDIFKKQCGIITRLADDFVDLELEKVDKIINKIDADVEHKDVKRVELELWKEIKDKIVKSRRVGIGVTALADAIALCGIKYDSDDALKLCDKIFKLKNETEFETTAFLAKERGAFPVYNWNKEKDNKAIKMLSVGTQELIKKYGRRNIALSTVAPTGSLSLLTQTSSGIEPVYQLSYVRRKKLLATDEKAGIKADFIDVDGEKFINFNVYHNPLLTWLENNKPKKMEDSPWYKCTAHDIDWMFRIKLQALIQKYTGHSISSTCNVSKDVTKDTISQIYMEAWKQGLKGITVYRDTSRSGILISDNKAQSIISAKNHAPKRKDILECDIHHSTIDGKNWILFVGMQDGIPYEIFGGKKEKIEIPMKYTKGWIKKNGKVNNIRKYDLILGSLDTKSDDYMIIHDVVSNFTVDQGTFTRCISLMLRHNIPLEYICLQLNKDSENKNMFCFEKSISRVLKKYVKNGTVSGETCDKCNSKLVFENGCYLCRNCGYSKCS